MGLQLVSLAAWDHAAARAATRLVQAVFEGDSTFAGQTQYGDIYSPITRVRELLAAADIPDGGHGVMNGDYDNPLVSGEPEDAGITQQSWNLTTGQNLKANYLGATNIPGTVLAGRLYGTRVMVTAARYGSPTVIDITIDGDTQRVTVPTKGTAGGTADTNWQAGAHFLTTGLADGPHDVEVELVSGVMSTLIHATRNVGVVLNNFAARGERAVDVPWHQMQDWAGLTATNTEPVTPASIDSGPSSYAPALGIYNKGTNDSDVAAYQAKATAFAQAFIYRGASAVICSPCWEASGRTLGASDTWRAASQQAAEDSGATWLDLGLDGALAGNELGSGPETIGGANANPHLTALGYGLQGDYIAAALLANYTGQVGETPSPGVSDAYRLVDGLLVPVSVYSLVGGDLVTRSLTRA